MRLSIGQGIWNSGIWNSVIDVYQSWLSGDYPQLLKKEKLCPDVVK